jgi:hypothetical protein
MEPNSNMLANFIRVLQDSTENETKVNGIIDALLSMARKHIAVVVQCRPSHVIIQLMRSSNVRIQLKAAEMLKQIAESSLSLSGANALAVKSCFLNDLKSASAIPALVQTGLGPLPIPPSAPAAVSPTAIDPNADPTIAATLSRVDMCLDSLTLICPEDPQLCDNAIKTIAGPGPHSGLSSRLCELLTHWAFRKTSLKTPSRIRRLTSLLLACSPNSDFQQHLELTRTMDHCLIMVLAVGAKFPEGGFMLKELLDVLGMCKLRVGLAHRIGRNVMVHVGRYRDAVLDAVSKHVGVNVSGEVGWLRREEAERKLKKVVEAAGMLASMAASHLSSSQQPSRERGNDCK